MQHSTLENKGEPVTHQPPADDSPAVAETKKIRPLLAWGLLTINGLWLLIAIQAFLFPGDGPREEFASRAWATFGEFPDPFMFAAGGLSIGLVGLPQIALPLLAVLLITHIQPVVPNAKPALIVALIEYGASALFGLIAFISTFTVEGDDQGRVLTESAFYRIGLFGLLGLAAFVVWKTAAPYLVRPPGYGQYGPFGQPGGWPQGPGQPSGPAPLQLGPPPPGGGLTSSTGGWPVISPNQQQGQPIQPPQPPPAGPGGPWPVPQRPNQMGLGGPTGGWPVVPPPGQVSGPPNQPGPAGPWPQQPSQPPVPSGPPVPSSAPPQQQQSPQQPQHPAALPQQAGWPTPSTDPAPSEDQNTQIVSPEQRQAMEKQQQQQPPNNPPSSWNQPPAG